MEVILLETFDKLGQIGDIVKVKNGFARNYLIPNKKALRANKANKEVFQGIKEDLIEKNKQFIDKSKSLLEKIENKEIVFIRNASDNGQLYGSVNARDISQALRDDGFNVSRNQVRLDQPIKNLGLHDVSVTLHPEVSISVTANVARSKDEAQIQAETGRALLSQAEEETLAATKTAEAGEFSADEAVAEQADYLIVKWDKSVLKGGGTHGEVTMAYWLKKPIYLVNNLPIEDVSSWIFSCSEEIFDDFEDLKKRFSTLF